MEKEIATGWLEELAGRRLVPPCSAHSAGYYVLAAGGVTGTCGVVAIFAGIEATTMTATASNK
jgi:hypothetical protein